MRKTKISIACWAVFIVSFKVELELRMDTACPNYSRSKGEQVELSESVLHKYNFKCTYLYRSLPTRLP